MGTDLVEGKKLGGKAERFEGPVSRLFGIFSPRWKGEDCRGEGCWGGGRRK